MDIPEHTPSPSPLNILLALDYPSEAIIGRLTRHKVDILPKKNLLLDYVSQKNYHLIFLEKEIEKLYSIKSVDPRVEVFLFGDKDLDIIESLNSGASACFTRPVNLDQLDEAVRKVAELVEVRKETGEIEKLLKNKYTFSGVVGKNPQMLEIFNFIRRIAPYYRSVLISGETGTGKEAVARALHDTQGANHPFLVCNCGALVENLIESELFGHNKGAFTGAVMDKAGLFEAAGEGTLLLDEIGEMPLSFQPHLLRVLENGEFRRLGSNKPLLAKCRVIASTNRDLEAEVKKRNFREDLFFRLARLTIQIPPLRERVDDIPLICRHLLNRFNQRTGKVIYGIARPAMTRLMAYPWPGNVRELESVLEKAAILTQKSFINLDDIPIGVSESKKSVAGSLMSLDLLERSHIEKTLAQCKGNRTRAAEILKISRRALLRKIEKYKLS